MITAKRLKELLTEVDDNATVWAYEGECTGIAFETDNKTWWIEARESKAIDTYTQGFIVRRNWAP